MKRTVRLKEWGVNVDIFNAVAAEYRKLCDTTLEEGPFRLRTDEHGFIKNAIEIRSEAPPIVFLGDSLVECCYVHEGYRLTDRVQQELSAALRFDGAVINAGMTGATSLHSLFVLLTKVLPLRPSTVILMNGGMNIDCGFQRSSFWSRVPYLTPYVFEDESAAHIAEANDSPDFLDRGKLLKIIETTCVAFGIRFAMATFAHRIGDQHALTTYGDDFMRSRDLFRDINATTRHFCQENNIALIDIEASFDAADGVLYDRMHLNKSGCERVGRFVSDRIVETHLLDL